MAISWMKKDICTYEGILAAPLEIDERSIFFKDYGSIIYRSQFRRLSNKTQVFLNPYVDFPRTRLTHSIEVEQIGRELSRYFTKLVINKISTLSDSDKESFGKHFEDLVAAACLAHDLGQAPFGHRGEQTLQELMANEKTIKQQDYFEANKQNIRILIGTEGRKPYGVSCELIESIMKYNSSIFNQNNNKYPGYYSHESQVINLIQKCTSIRHPACYIMEVSDDISYISSDIQDALKLKLISTDQIREEFKSIKFPEQQGNLNIHNWDEALKDCTDNDFTKITSLLIKCMLETVKRTLENFFKMWAARDNITDLPQKMYDYFQAGDCELNLLYFGEGEPFKKLKKSIYRDYLLQDKEIARSELLAKKVLTDLWSIMVQELTDENFEKTDFFKIIPNYVQKNIMNAHRTSQFQEQKFQYLSDYLSGMTDRYAIFLWTQIFDPTKLKFM
ncbi:dGTP triphosphohydrolase [Legionella sp.]|uniref:deoxyguanosinetriphosphate triphosphohydrolase family protein n=1 Tax=Legionella sp. TaxID=459 RepID=UPI00322003C8